MEAPAPCPVCVRRRRWRNRLGNLGFIAGIVLVVYWILPPIARVREPAARMASSNNLKQMALAMHNYEDNNLHVPGANAPYLDPKDGSKKLPVSWRVLILPYVEQEVIYQEYRLDEPWDGPSNIRLSDRMPKVYSHPKADLSVLPKGRTHYRVFASRAGAKPSALFTDGLPGPKFKEIPDGTSNTILIVEAAEAVPWTMPEVLLYDRNQPLPKLGGLFRGQFQAALADGSVRSFRSDMPDEKLRAWITKDGGDLANDE